MEALLYLQSAQKHFLELDIPCRLDRATAEYPVDMLVFSLEDIAEQYPEETAALTMFFARPDAAFCKEMQMRILHLTAYLGKAQGGAAEELRRYFGHINVQLPLGSFDVDADGDFYYRYNLLIPDEMGPELFLRQAAGAYAVMRACMAMFLIHVFEVKSGIMEADEAAARMREDVARAADIIHAAVKGE